MSRAAVDVVEILCGNKSFNGMGLAPRDKDFGDGLIRGMGEIAEIAVREQEGRRRADESVIRLSALKDTYRTLLGETLNSLRETLWKKEEDLLGMKYNQAAREAMTPEARVRAANEVLREYLQDLFERGVDGGTRALRVEGIL